MWNHKKKGGGGRSSSNSNNAVGLFLFFLFLGYDLLFFPPPLSPPIFSRFQAFFFSFSKTVKPGGQLYIYAKCSKKQIKGVSFADL